MKQEGTLSNNYFRRIDALLNKVQMVEQLSESSVMNFFIGGMSSTLQGPVRLL